MEDMDSLEELNSEMQNVIEIVIDLKEKNFLLEEKNANLELVNARLKEENAIFRDFINKKTSRLKNKR